MLTTVEASRTISDAMPDFGMERVGLNQANGRVLRQSVRAERDQPPFDRVTMDGIAIRFDSLEAERRAFSIQGTQHAGDPVLTLLDDRNCIEIMTGAVLPRGCDCVIPVERITIADQVASIDDAYTAKARQFIHSQASDHAAGHEVLHPGSVISPLEIAIIASCGLNEIDANRMPVVRVISTGNELVPAGKPIDAHQIRMSNGPALVAMVADQGFTDVAHEHVVDDPSTLKARISAHLNTADVLILSGGVSMGKADFVPQILKDLGVRLVFHKVSQRPGKPMWFGVGPENQAVFALPGNPVSSLVCCRQYALPALWQACGRTGRAVEYATLASDISFAPQLTFFLPVRLNYLDNGTTNATPVATNTSGDFAALGGTDGYVELDRERNEFAAGDAVPLHRWDAP